jgi:hypothetical protein
MTSLETEMRRITELTSFDPSPETHTHIHELDARVTAIELLMTEAGFRLPSQK